MSDAAPSSLAAHPGRRADNGAVTADPPLTVRPFVDDDAPALTAFLHEAYAELGARGLNFTAVDQSEETTRSRARGGRCWVVERGGEIVATLTMSLPPSSALQRLTPEARVPGRVWLNQMGVSPRLRGVGLARLLWDTGAAWAAEQGATSVGIDTAVPATHLVDLYTRWGFVPRDIIHWPGKTYDSLVMVRGLEPDA